MAKPLSLSVCEHNRQLRKTRRKILFIFGELRQVVLLATAIAVCGDGGGDDGSGNSTERTYML